MAEKYFARGPANVDTLLATTLSLHGKELMEQWYKKSPITKSFLNGNGLKEVTGGRDIVVPVNYANSGTVAQISATSSLPTTVAEMASQARFDWAGLGGSVALRDWDKARNAGDSKEFDMLALQLENVMEEMHQSLEAILLGAVTVSTSSIWSLLDVVDSANPNVGNYGEIDRSAYAWWQGVETGSLASANIREALLTAYNTSGRNGMDPISFVVGTQTLLEAYDARLVAHQRLSQGDKGELGFGSLLFMEKPFFYSDAMLANTILGINTKHTKMYVNSKMKFDKSPFLRAPGAQAESAMLRLMLQIVCDRPLSNFKLTFTS